MTSSDPLAAYKSLIPAMHPAYLQAGSPFAAYSPFAFPNALDPLGAYANALNAVKSAMPPHSAGFPGFPYGRMKSPAGPVDSCRDPYCTGCPSSLAGSAAMAAMTMVCPVGCPGVQCEHPRIPIPHVSTSSSSSSSTPSSAPSISAGNPSANRPYVCNWIVGDNYCGKRFPSSEDLLQHLRTHTNLSTSEPSASSMSAGAPSSVPTAAFPHPLRTYPTPPLSPLSAARYHPYGKGSSTGLQGYPTSLLGVPLPPSNPAAAALAGSYPPFFHHPGLAPYYSHLSMFGPRVGTAPLPP